jgi:BirA family biotin operon repressor/biotin-[acetyl-CoA-carboxylase] ligase
MTAAPDVLDARDLAARLAPLPLGRVEVVDRVSSTSTELARAAAQDPAAWPDRSVLVADHQDAGRGRAGRTWTTPRGAALTVSVLLRPDPARVPVEALGWVPLLGGLAAALALRDLGAPAVLKWPNDVLLPTGTDEPEVAGWGAHRKVAGVLADVVPGGAVVLGIGLNVAQRAEQLPVPSATSLALAGVAVSRADVLVALLARWVEADAAWRAAGGVGPVEDWSRLAVTLGRAVRVALPGGGELVGTAVALEPDGALRVAHVGGTTLVRAGDVTLRTV